MIVLGEHDIITPLADADLIYRRAAGARRMDVIPRAGHLSPLENPAAFNAALVEFLRS